MPKKYEAIRDGYVASGKSEKRAKKLAAMTYNAQRKSGEAPVTGKHKADKKVKHRKKRFTIRDRSRR